MSHSPAHLVMLQMCCSKNKLQKAKKKVFFIKILRLSSAALHHALFRRRGSSHDNLNGYSHTAGPKYGASNTKWSRLSRVFWPHLNCHARPAASIVLGRLASSRPSDILKRNVSHRLTSRHHLSVGPSVQRLHFRAHEL